MPTYSPHGTAAGGVVGSPGKLRDRESNPDLRVQGAACCPYTIPD